MFPIDWSNFQEADLRIVLDLPAQPTYDIEPNKVLTLRPRINIEAQMGIIEAIDKRGGAISVSIKFRYTTQSGEKRVEGKFVVRRVIDGNLTGMARGQRNLNSE